MKYELVPKSLDLKRKKRGSFISSVSMLEEEMFAESDFPEAVVPSSIIHIIVFCQTFEMQINMPSLFIPLLFFFSHLPYAANYLLLAKDSLQ